jgi:single-strand DNA-binding protein
MNNFIICGRIASFDEQDDKSLILTCAVPRSYKNADGTYDTDFIRVRVTGNMAETSKEYLKKGDMIGIKGLIDLQDNKPLLAAQKVTFLSSTKKGDDE